MALALTLFITYGCVMTVIAAIQGDTINELKAKIARQQAGLKQGHAKNGRSVNVGIRYTVNAKPKS